MLYEEFEKLTRGLATYDQFEAIEQIYMTSNISKKDAATLWYLSYGQNSRPVLNTLRQKLSYLKQIPKLELNRLFWTLYESGKPLIYDEKLGMNFTLLVGNRTKLWDCFYLHLAVYHGLDVGTGNITVIPTGWRNYGTPAPCWQFLRDTSVIKVKNMEDTAE